MFQDSEFPNLFLEQTRIYFYDYTDDGVVMFMERIKKFLKTNYAIYLALFLIVCLMLNSYIWSGTNYISGMIHYSCGKYIGNVGFYRFVAR